MSDVQAPTRSMDDGCGGIELSVRSGEKNPMNRVSLGSGILV